VSSPARPPVGSSRAPRSIDDKLRDFLDTGRDDLREAESTDETLRLQLAWLRREFTSGYSFDGVGPFMWRRSRHIYPPGLLVLPHRDKRMGFHVHPIRCGSMPLLSLDRGVTVRTASRTRAR
jgi:hypothetical protein